MTKTKVSNALNKNYNTNKSIGSMAITPFTFLELIAHNEHKKKSDIKSYPSWLPKGEGTKTVEASSEWRAASSKKQGY